MRTIGVVTGARSDYSILLPVIREIQSRSELQLHVLVTGMHMAPEFGLTISEIERDGLPISERIEMLVASDTAEGIAKSMGLGMIGFSQALARLHLDLLLVLGDRSEILAAVSAALPFRLPVAHIAGGDITLGAIDDCVRHAITKLSHLHFVSTNESRDRVVQMGEEPWRVHVTGLPSIDHILNLEPTPLSVLENELQMSLVRPFLLVTMHPETQSEISSVSQIQTVLNALESFPSMSLVFTAPNSDKGGRCILAEIEAWVARHANARLVPSLGGSRYSTLMRHTTAVVGNSSSGVLETPSFKVPAVNVGLRQQGRIHAQNVIDVAFDSDAIKKAIADAASPELRARCAGVCNPYGDGKARLRIVDQLQSVELGPHLTTKRFCDAILAVPRAVADPPLPCS